LGEAALLEGTLPMVAGRIQVLQSLLSLEVQLPGKMIAYVEWAHKVLLLLQGISGDEPIGFLV
jgi:hypothetical protein